jgi:hypothetical protein
MAVDGDRLLDGENPETAFVDDARHWMQVYGELVRFKEDVMSSLHERLGAVEKPEAVAEVADTDLETLRAERKRLRRRLEFWESRYTDLLGADA